MVEATLLVGHAPGKARMGIGMKRILLGIATALLGTATYVFVGMALASVG